MRSTSWSPTHNAWPMVRSKFPAKFCAKGWRHSATLRPLCKRICISPRPKPGGVSPERSYWWPQIPTTWQSMYFQLHPDIRSSRRLLPMAVRMLATSSLLLANWIQCSLASNRVPTQPLSILLSKKRWFTKPEPGSPSRAVRLCVIGGSYLAEHGTPLSDEEIRSKRGLFFRGLRDGNDEYLLRCDPLDSEVIRSFCEAWTNPRSHKSAPFSASTSPSTASPQNVRDSGWDEPRQPDAGSVSGTPTFSPAGAPIPQWARATDAKSVPLSQLDCGLPPDGSGFESFADKDPRNTPQLWLDAIIAACSGALSGSDMSQTGGTKVKISVLIGYRSLLGQAEDAGLTAGGRAISAENIRRLACNADILPAVLGTEGEILNLGRESRGFSKAQRKSMAIRDRGCIYPGCTRTAATSEAHHVKSWLSGGETSVANSSTLCLYHHLQVHAGLITLQSIGGIPYVIAIAGQARGDPQRNLYWHPELRTAGYTQPMFD
ncbi:hypothetical protein CGQ24_09675 [Arthrobacter sp. 7749]|nr:hypothetical protein CGQ24_09675 [Arthrobacter sp. 7749]